jgi:hypothetical protein
LPAYELCPGTSCIGCPFHSCDVLPSCPAAGLKVIKKKLVRKAIDMIKKLADGEARAKKELEEKKEEEGERAAH